ncbi:hypothetical protein [Pseudomonas fulva]|uniref:hypothetical protein n=1 Tax=Pseudomonas fulva TaxID=47880 RepID=UPI0011B648E1|nr:hypothetical protein [Pseudomonas fulva]
MLKDLRSSYKGTWNLWAAYWRIYGGWKAVFTSLYLCMAVVVSAICYFLWSKPSWWDVVISAVPTMLGFTLAGLAVFLGMDSKFSSVIAGGNGKGTSPFLQLIASFVHFVVVQVLALVAALLAKSTFFYIAGLPSWYYQLIDIVRPFVWCIGFTLFVYAVFSMLAATFTIFRTTQWYDAFVVSAKSASKE